MTQSMEPQKTLEYINDILRGKLLFTSTFKLDFPITQNILESERESIGIKRVDSSFLEKGRLTCLLLDFTEHREQGRLHAMTVERVFASLSFVQGLFRDAHDLLQNLSDVLLLADLVLIAGILAIVLARHSVALRGHHSARMGHHTIGIFHVSLPSFSATPLHQRRHH